MGGIDPEPGATKSLSGITAKASKTQKEVPDLNWSQRESSFTQKKYKTPSKDAPKVNRNMPQQLKSPKMIKVVLSEHRFMRN